MMDVRWTDGDRDIQVEFMRTIPFEVELLEALGLGQAAEG